MHDSKMYVSRSKHGQEKEIKQEHHAKQSYRVFSKIHSIRFIFYIVLCLE